MHRFALGLLLVAMTSVPAMGQTFFQPDVHGYGTQLDGAMFVYRDPGSQQIRVGIMDFRDGNNGTIGNIGTSNSVPQARYESYSAPRQSWPDSGNTRYPRYPKGRYPRTYYGGSYNY